MVDRRVDVPLVRLGRWLDGFAQRHGTWAVESEVPPPSGGRADAVVASGGAVGPVWSVRAEDGSLAVVHGPAWLADVEGAGDGDTSAFDPDALAGLRPVFGAILLRRAGYAVALFSGRELVERKLATRHIHGRTAAGGWSQQRYARRRANQADEIVSACATAAALLLTRPHRSPAQFLVTGGDRPLVAAALAELPPAVAALPVRGRLSVGTPDRRVLAALPDRVLAVSIEVVDPG